MDAMNVRGTRYRTYYDEHALWIATNILNLVYKLLKIRILGDEHKICKYGVSFLFIIVISVFVISCISAGVLS